MFLARRLVEAGVRFVNVGVGGWDMHQSIADSMKKVGAVYDRGIAALVAELYVSVCGQNRHTSGRS